MKPSALLFVAIPCLLAGCATEKFAGVEEYKQLTGQAETAVQGALGALEQISTNTGHSTPKRVAGFDHAVQRLQVDSIGIRARARAIQARGDSYFASWSESIANIKDPRVRASAERFHPELEASFSRIKLASQRAGTLYEPFSAGLQKVRVDLEIRPESIDRGSDRELIQNTLEKGRQLLQELGHIDSELLAIKKMLKPI